jgi:hypothetical protein
MFALCWLRMGWRATPGGTSDAEQGEKARGGAVLAGLGAKTLLFQVLILYPEARRV